MKLLDETRLFNICMNSCKCIKGKCFKSSTSNQWQVRVLFKCRSK